MLLLLLLLLNGCAGAAVAPAPPLADPVAIAEGTITAADVQRRIAFIASDAMRGRDTPSPGLEQTADYLAGELRALGFEPAGDSGTFIQRYPYNNARLDRARIRVEARSSAGTLAPQYTRDYFLLPAPVDSVAGTPIFAGIAGVSRSAPAGARGSILIYYVPGNVGEQWQATVGAALQSAFTAGAGAVVLALDSTFEAATLAQIADEASGQVLPLPVVGITYAVARDLLQRGGLDLAALRTGTPPAAPLQGVSMLIQPAMQSGMSRVPNVVGVLRGSDPALREEYVVLSAHFDHVGVGEPDARGDSIFNGADDNGTGTSTLLEVAEAYARLQPRPARSLMVVFVSGEEKGLLGSAYFVEHPPVPVARMVANINVDMVGRNAPDTVVAIGQDYSSLGAAVQRIARAHPELRLTVAPDLWPAEQLFFRSDHFSFAAKEVPAIFFTAGLHADYHAPSDEPATIDNDKVARVSRLLFRLTHDLAGTAARPQWTEQGLAEVRRQTAGR